MPPPPTAFRRDADRTGSWRFPVPSTTCGGWAVPRCRQVRQPLRGRRATRPDAALRPSPSAVRFLNDADAFGVGEYAVGAARGHDRAVCITLGTGVGSAFLDRGRPVNSGPTVPPDGSIHLVVHDGRPIEETVSRRAIRTAYATSAAWRPPTWLPTCTSSPNARGRRRPGTGDPDERLRRTWGGPGSARPAVRGQHRGPRRFHDRLVGHRRASRPLGLLGTAPDLGHLELRPAERNQVAALLGAAFWSVNQPS